MSLLPFANAPGKSTGGSTGPTGPTGSQGTAGSQGIQGTTGTNGSTGPTGPTGSQGIQGTAGSNGSQGIQGTAGSQGIQGTAGSQGIQGTAGSQGIQGTAGSNGTNGVTGPTGPTGSGGSAAGATGQVQFNAGAGAFGATSNFNWDNTNTRLGIGKTPAGALDVVGDIFSTSTIVNTNAASDSIIQSVASTLSDSKGRIEALGNATNGRGKMVISGAHTGFDGTQNDDGPSILEMWANNQGSNPLTFAWTTANGVTPGLLKLDVVNNGAGGTITGMVAYTAAGNVGIGTIAPAAKLDVNGTVNAASGILTRVASVATASSPTPNATTTDIYEITAQNVTGAFGVPTGTPLDGQKLIVQVTPSGTGQSMSWSTATGGYTGTTTFPLPLTTGVTGKMWNISFMYVTANSINKWMCVNIVKQ